MTDDEGERLSGGAAGGHAAAEDRGEVRSETEGTAPDEQGSVAGTAGTESSEQHPAAEPEPAVDPDPQDAPVDEVETGPEPERKKAGSFWRELPVLIVVALALALLIKAFVVQAFYIPSASMENTLQIGDRVLVNKLVYRQRDIARGDIVVFNGLDSWDPESTVQTPSNPVLRALHAVGTAFGLVPGEKDYIKRVIGVPGDHVVCCDAAGKVTVNGVPLEESPYLYTDPTTGEQNLPSTQKFDVVVPKDRLWVMGDHREVSWDSRGHQADPGYGTIPESSVVGRAFVVVWPVGHWKILEIPATFQQHGLGSALGATPLVLGFAGALPAVWLRRRRRA